LRAGPRQCHDHDDAGDRALSKLIGRGANRAAIALPVIAQTVKVLGI
jgi:hypothetical protein